MTKIELIDKVTEGTTLAKKEVERILETTITAIQEALKKGEKVLNQADGKEASKIKKHFENTEEVKDQQRRAHDVLFTEAHDQITELLSSKPNFDMHLKYRLREFDAAFGRKYVSNISRGDIAKFVESLEKKGNTGPTIKRKLNDLGTMFRHFKDHNLFLGESPTKGMKVKGAEYQAREITLEDHQQRDLLKGCYDPQATMHFQHALRTAKEQYAKKAETKLSLRFDNSEVIQKRAFEIFKSNSALNGSKRLFEHLASQNHGRSLDARTLHEIVFFELTYGLRKGEILGVAHRVKGETIHLGGLRVGHWDSAKKTLTVMRTKKGRNGGVSRSSWIVTDKIADLMDRRCKGKQPDDFIFDNEGKPLHNFDKSFEEAVKFAGVEVEVIDKRGMKKKIHPQFRDLRHVACCNLLDSGLSVEEVARILGHSTTKMVQQVYGNRMKETTQQRQAERTAAGMDRILGG